MSSYVDALLHERFKCKVARQWDRVREIDRQLTTFGIAVADASESTEIGDEIEIATAVVPEKAVRPRGRPRQAR